LIQKQLQQRQKGNTTRRAGKSVKPGGPSLIRSLSRRAAWPALTAALIVGAFHPFDAHATRRPTPTIDPRLVLKPHAVPVKARFHTVEISGTLYPSLPGHNILRLSVRGDRGDAGRFVGGDVVVTMSGMRMAPSRAHLRVQGYSLVGTIELAMFGRYLARITLHGNHSVSGTVPLTVPLPSL